MLRISFGGRNLLKYLGEIINDCFRYSIFLGGRLRGYDRADGWIKMPE